jgi:hypothetical protein
MQKGQRNFFGAFWNVHRRGDQQDGQWCKKLDEINKMDDQSAKKRDSLKRSVRLWTC